MILQVATQSINPANSINTIGQYGAVGAICVLALFGLVWLFRKYDAQREKREVQMQAEIDALNKKCTKLEEDFQHYITEERQSYIKLLSSIDDTLKENTSVMRDVLKKL